MFPADHDSFPFCRDGCHNHPHLVGYPGHKLVRLISDENGYSRNIGLSYAFYGLAGLILGFFNSWLVATSHRVVTSFLCVPAFILGGLIMVLAVLSSSSSRKFEGEIGSSEGGFSVKQIGQVL